MLFRSDYSELIEYLRTSNNIYDHKAADALEAQAKRIEELEAALMPFAKKELSTEPVLQPNSSSPIEFLQNQIKGIEESDAIILAARKALENGDD